MKLLPLVSLIGWVGCAAGGGAPELSGVADHVVVVGSELRIDLDGTDPDGDQLAYGFRAPPDLKGLDGRAIISVAPSGAGVFRWTPIGSDLGEHSIDFTVSDGETEVVLTVTVNVVNSVTSPIFRAPLGSGTTLDLDAKECLELDVMIEDQDTTAVTLTQQAPILAGATLDVQDDQSATWRWCPTTEQRTQPRHTLVLAADDGQNPQTIKNYVIVLRGGVISNTCADDASEDDDLRSQARETTFPSFSSTANVTCANDDDWYRVPLFTGEVMTVNLTFDQATAQQDLDIHLYKGDIDLTPCDVERPQACSIANGQGADSNERTVFTVPSGCSSSCDYFVVVRGYDASSAPYAISIEIQ